MVNINIQLTQKERLLLGDQKSHEEMCIKKYTEYANQAQDPKLKQMFQKHAQQEQQHLNTVNQILGGQSPSMQSQGGQSNQQSASQNQQPTQQMQNTTTPGNYNAKDKDMCDDLLMTEKYISSTYDTTIFECVDTNVRQTLNHIQKEEQEHGEQIFNYMQCNGMYTPQ